jgi:hypothetical protein
MTRHPFRWGRLVLGLLYLACSAAWVVRREDVLSARQLSLTASGVLIALGVVGVAATLRHARSTTSPSTTTSTTSTTAPGDSHDAPAHPHA